MTSSCVVPNTFKGQTHEKVGDIQYMETDDKNFQFYLRIFGCSLPEPYNFVLSSGLNETAEIL
jgi:hypothetical protein